jgi:hypothetical protein
LTFAGSQRLSSSISFKVSLVVSNGRLRSLEKALAWNSSMAPTLLRPAPSSDFTTSGRDALRWLMSSTTFLLLASTAWIDEISRAEMSIIGMKTLLGRLGKRAGAPACLETARE